MSRQATVQEELKRRAKSAIIMHAFLRAESALTIALTLIVIFLFPTPFPWWQWWYWLILGIVGEALIVYTSIMDESTGQQVVSEMLRDKFNPGELRNPKHRAKLEQALDYRRRIEEITRRQEPGVLRDHLENNMAALTDWIANIFRLAKRLEAYENDAVLQRDLKTLPQEISQAEARLKAETNVAVQQEIMQNIASRRAQLQNLNDLQDAIEKAEMQMENTLTSLGTLYSQILLLDAKKVDRTQARDIAQNIRDQVDTLQNIVTTMDEVYGRTI